MAKLVSVPTSPDEGAEAQVVQEGTLDHCAELYRDWQTGIWSEGHHGERPRHEALVLVGDDGVPVCAAS